MSLPDTWRIISARIHGLNAAAKLDAILRPSAQGTTGSTAYLQSQAIEIYAELENFRRVYEPQLPAAALAVLQKALELGRGHVGSQITQEINRGITGNYLVHLQAI